MILRLGRRIRFSNDEEKVDRGSRPTWSAASAGETQTISAEHRFQSLVRQMYELGIIELQHVSKKHPHGPAEVLLLQIPGLVLAVTIAH